MAETRKTKKSSAAGAARPAQTNEQAKKPEAENNLQRLARIGIWAVIIAVVIVVVIVITRPKPTAYSVKKIQNDGYTYSFKFYDKAVPKQSQGHNYYAYKSKDFGVIVNAQPYTGPAYTNCFQLGGGWSELFKVGLQGKQYPICTQGQADFVTVFPVDGQLQLFSIVYQPAQTTSIYTDLRTIFPSLKVIKN